MERVAIISVDGHVKAPRERYRDYLEKQHLAAFDEWLAQVAPMPDGLNVSPALGPEAQWDSARRAKDLESQGVVAEVLFPNGMAFDPVSIDQRDQAVAPGLGRAARDSYNRWLVDFCAELPGRRAGQAVVSFGNVDQAVKDIHWAKEQGLRGIAMPPLRPGDTFFFDPALDPIWAACQETGLPLSQHGGAGVPAYKPLGFAMILTLAVEHSFYSGRSMWQMMLGGVFDRFPDLQVVFVETEAHWIGHTIEQIDRKILMSEDWVGFARSINLERPFAKLTREYWASNCWAGISPFTPLQIPMDELVGKEEDGSPREGFSIGADRAMFGVDYPHFETVFPKVGEQVSSLVGHPSVNEEDARKILYGNAAKIYGFDLEALAPDVERVGFELSAYAS